MLTSWRYTGHADGGRNAVLAEVLLNRNYEQENRNI